MPLLYRWRFWDKIVCVDKNISAEEAAALVAHKVHEERPHSRAYHRAGRNVKSSHSMLSKMSSASLSREPSGGDQHGSDDIRTKPEKCAVEFSTNTVSVYEGERRARLGVRRTGCLSSRVSIKFETCDGTAEAGTDYVARKDTLLFQPREDYK